MDTRILLVEDDAQVQGSLRKRLQAEAYEVATAGRGDEGLALAIERSFDVVISDLKLPGLSGIDLVRQLHPAKPKLPIILITAFPTAEAAIEATRLGAFDFVLKPFDMPELLGVISKAAACNHLMSAPLELGECASDRAGIVGRSRVMQELYKEIGRAAASSTTTLIRGETGTGKELVARAIHQYSERAEQPFIAVNCNVIPEQLLESELFGHERGAFTGAHTRRIGRFEQAHLGTLFLDEIGDLNPGTQAKLLRILEERHLQRLGSSKKVPVDVRVLAATHRNLEAAMADKQFREDLFFRLSPLTIQVPTLSQRTSDIPELAAYFLRRHAIELRVSAPSIESQAIAYLQDCTWRGNVRELENVLREALLLARDHAIGVTHVEKAYLHARGIAATPQSELRSYFTGLIEDAQAGKVTNVRAKVLEEVERDLFAQAMSLAQGNQARAARWLGVDRKTLREKLMQFGLQPAGGLHRPGTARQ